MKILSIDTASDICGVSILDDSNLICNLDNNTGRTHSENLMPMIDSAFSKTNLSLNNINLIVCDKGPGSFTGIRIGVATVKAFNDSLSIPCIGISSLESLVYNVKQDLQENDFICSIIDCKNDNCYYAIYQLSNNQIKKIVEPKADNIEVFRTLSSDFQNKNITFVGDGSLIYKDYLTSIFKNCNFSNKNELNSYSTRFSRIRKI